MYALEAGAAGGRCEDHRNEDEDDDCRVAVSGNIMRDIVAPDDRSRRSGR